MVIKYLPVLPPNLRPIVKLQDKTVIITDLNLLYSKIINVNNKIKKIKKMLIPDKFLTTEINSLQISVESLINNDNTKNNASLQISLLLSKIKKAKKRILFKLIRKKIYLKN